MYSIVKAGISSTSSNSKIIEKFTISGIDKVANNTFKINSYLNSNETKISFDGELEIYSA